VSGTIRSAPRYASGLVDCAFFRMTFGFSSMTAGSTQSCAAPSPRTASTATGVWRKPVPLMVGSGSRARAIA